MRSIASSRGSSKRAPRKSVPCVDSVSCSSGIFSTMTDALPSLQIKESRCRQRGGRGRHAGSRHQSSIITKLHVEAPSWRVRLLNWRLVYTHRITGVIMYILTAPCSSIHTGLINVSKKPYFITATLCTFCSSSIYSFASSQSTIIVFSSSSKFSKKLSNRLTACSTS
jgi:hypothetical protein